MAQLRPKRVLGLILLLLVFGIIAYVIVGLVESDEWAVDAARAACRDRGLQLDKLEGMQSEVRSTFIGRTAVIRFKGRRQDRPATIRVDLRKPTIFSGWEVTDVREEPVN